MTDFSINNFPISIQVDNIISNELPYAKVIQSGVQFESHEFYEAYDFSEKSQFKTQDKEKDGFIEVSSGRGHNK
ncbi:hypothetical protein EHI8A_068360 [Entamoeba histolytica HM-1:IMSS-B]|uniref:Single tm domain protein n=4 Tax=Entamoeba histolytica TaxID=5759 RepID=A0A175JH20_ENTHI|nr:hypothetical protein EHI8A_068360 [Entamoeba histolytica HM-1:IMSS-B]EMS16180.1 hypothetical protein KM1_123490 [Entamoeba histolytica HM-3:IMSS]ENY61859.1 unknown protein, putative [Entamoeba histolytica HM-1:IMSS-A]GAT92723.1 single tm domain protein [Entamoeba histolytica]